MCWKKTYFEVDIGRPIIKFMQHLSPGLVFSDKKNDFGADMEKRKN